MIASEIKVAWKRRGLSSIPVKEACSPRMYGRCTSLKFHSYAGIWPVRMQINLANQQSSRKEAALSHTDRSCEWPCRKSPARGAASAQFCFFCLGGGGRNSRSSPRYCSMAQPGTSLALFRKPPRHVRKLGWVWRERREGGRTVPIAVKQNDLPRSLIPVGGHCFGRRACRGRSSLPFYHTKHGKTRGGKE